ncbi:MAG TPA: molecular chaperone DnaK, partial [Candidatus Brocadiales bacterium]|nr:molecular chaperone DnaK [Candidatus Brocadiales bacterium]
DKQEIESKMDALTGTLHEISKDLYQKTTATDESASGGEPPTGEPKEEQKKKKPGDEDIIDADYKVKE